MVTFEYLINEFNDRMLARYYLTEMNEDLFKMRFENSTATSKTLFEISTKTFFFCWFRNYSTVIIIVTYANLTEIDKLTRYLPSENIYETSIQQ